MEDQATVNVARWRNDVAQALRACKPRKSRMDEDYNPPRDPDGPTPKPRGRPPKDPSKNSDHTKRVPLNDNPEALLKHSSLPSSSGKGSARSRSRSRTAKTFEQRKTTATIDLPYLGSCVPHVERRSYEAVRAKYKQLPEPVANLFSALTNIPHSVIPEPLQEQYLNDPSALIDPPHHRDFLPVEDTPYELSRLPALKILVDQIVREASFNHRMDAIERQWGGTVFGWLCGHLMSWPYDQPFRLLNIEQCSIEPSELHTKMPNGTRLIYSTEVESITDSSAEEDSNLKGVKKMVDWCLALALGYKDEDILEKAFTTIHANECSVNQSLSYIRRSPIFLDVELKKKQPATDPEVELAIWASGALQKKVHHGWDPTLPMPAITIEGHIWSWYMFIPKRGKSNAMGLLMLGPFSMGTTASLVGAWKIVYRLNILIKWGTTEYSKWFQDEVMGWARGRMGPPDEGDSSMSELWVKGMGGKDH
ncbi:MAG: hypothetical protein Q9211_000193 [Gyalolechia sp. 1 TL-2023]